MLCTCIMLGYGSQVHTQSMKSDLKGLNCRCLSITIHLLLPGRRIRPESSDRERMTGLEGSLKDPV